MNLKKKSSCVGRVCYLLVLLLLSVGLIRIYDKPFEIASEHIVFKFENDFKSNKKMLLARERVVFKLPVPQITGFSRRPFFRFLT